ncbi:MAG: cell division protein FtsA [bacterium]|nr:cell division protein FtsA [bacterium]
MAKDHLLCSLDIGSTKIATLIATLSQEDAIPKPHIIGVSTIPSRGIRKGQVVDIEETVEAISESMDAAERMAGCSVSDVHLSIGGSHIESQNSHGVVAVGNPKGEINAADVERVVEAAKAISLPSTREMLHVVPREYVVDGQKGIKDPIGMTGVRLEVDTHIIHGSTTNLQNLTKCIREVGVDVAGIVFNGIADAEAVLSETEKELGVVLVDIGGGTIDMVIFVEGAPAYSSVLPVGARNITNDIAVGLRVSLETAEKIKLELSKPPDQAMEEAGASTVSRLREKDMLDLSHLGAEADLRRISRKTLTEGIIRPRIEEIFTFIQLEIQKSGFAGTTPSGIVMTGGGSSSYGLVELGRRQIGMQVRIGVPSGMTGLVDEILTPAYSTPVGLVLYAGGLLSKEGGRSPFPRIQLGGVMGKGMDWLKNLLP